MTKIERIKITMARGPKRNYVAYTNINKISLDISLQDKY